MLKHTQTIIAASTDGADLLLPKTWVYTPGGVGNELPRVLEEVRALEGFIGDDYPDALSVLLARIMGEVAFTARSDAFWEPFIGPDAELGTGRGNAARAYARTVVDAYRSFARDAPTRCLNEPHRVAPMSNADYVRQAGLPTMRASRIKRYLKSSPFPPIV